MFTEEPVKITKPLTDAEVDEKGEITLTCEVNKLNKKPVWLMDDEEIKPSDRVKVTSRGLVHKLTIQTAKLHDEGKYTVAFGDVKSTANLTVKRKDFENNFNSCNVERRNEKYM